MNKHASYRQRFKTLDERFWEKVHKSNDCWEWVGARCNKGYGSIGIDGKTHRAHRVSWEIHSGKVPKDMCVLHVCDNPPCVNPDHLFLGTIADNNRDRQEKGRTQRGETHARTRFSNEQVRGMFAAKRFGFCDKSIMRLFNISAAHWLRLRNGESRKDITMRSST